MKKMSILILVLCMLFSSSSTVLAADTAGINSFAAYETPKSVNAVTVLKNFGYYIQEGPTSAITDHPNAGDDLNMRCDITSGVVDVYVKGPNDYAFRKIAHWTTTGRHYLDIDNHATAGAYQISFYCGAATFSGRVYTGNA